MIHLNTNDALSASQEADMVAGERALNAMSDLERLRMTAELRREDIARHERGTLHARTDADRIYHAGMLAKMRCELAKTEALIVDLCELRERMARPDAVAARRMAA